MSELFDWEHLKQLARGKVNRLERAGKIVRSKYCQLCGKRAKTEMHHWDHIGHPEEITQLCLPCHKIADAQKRKNVLDWERASMIGV